MSVYAYELGSMLGAHICGTDNLEVVMLVPVVKAI